jgi:hypothetical protein
VADKALHKLKLQSTANGWKAVESAGGCRLKIIGPQGTET